MPGMTMSPSPSMEKGRLASGSVMARGNSSLMGASKDLACGQRSASSWMQQRQCTACQGLHLLRQVHHHPMQMQGESNLMGMSDKLGCSEGRMWHGLQSQQVAGRGPKLFFSQTVVSSGQHQPARYDDFCMLVHCAAVMVPAEIQIKDEDVRGHTRGPDTALQSSPLRP